jgi:dihydroxy-acid dehydratase
VQDLGKEQKIISKKEQPLKASGHIQVLYGNLAEQGAVA